MNAKTIILPVVACGLGWLGGCQEYDIAARVDADGTGERTVVLVRDEAPDPETSHLLTLDEDRWTGIAGADAPDGKWRYTETRRIRDLAGWSTAGGLLLRGEATGRIRLVSDVQVEQARSGDGIRHVYRETLQWIGLREAVAAHAADNVVSRLRPLRPALPDTLLAEVRGVVVASLCLRWADLAAAEGDAAIEDRLVDEMLAVIADRLRRVGLAEERLRAIDQAIRDGDPYAGIEAALPGLDLCVQSSRSLSVTMPGPITGGNADSVAGATATWRVDLARTAGRPLVLEVESAR